METIVNRAKSLINEINTDKTTTQFQQNHSFQKRAEEANRILSKYPDRVPVIVEKDYRCKDIPDIDRKKYLVPDDLSIANFMYVIRKRIKLSPEKSLYLFVDGTNMVPTSQLVRQVYQDYSSPDNFLYIIYAGESTFG